ncbi:unnamed protein product [Haemonchus placei]|uniref:Transposase n=1 Tax=Haemonchus placei TaxID=6290 RepID=A0A0N4VVR8_HAEPC|nr:unnamed protein product [Haemonchus placei]
MARSIALWTGDAFCRAMRKEYGKASGGYPIPELLDTVTAEGRVTDLRLVQVGCSHDGTVRAVDLVKIEGTGPDLTVFRHHARKVCKGCHLHS